MKILHPVITLLRGMGIHCVTYLDNIPLMSQCREEAQQHTWTTVDLLESLGFLVTFKKSVLESTQELTFLGFILNSRKRELKLPQEKVALIKKEARSLLAWREVSPRDLARFIGKLSAAILAVYPAPLHYCSLQQLKHQVLRALTTSSSRYQHQHEQTYSGGSITSITGMEGPPSSCPPVW